MITGTTNHKLDIVRSYSTANPFQVGVNGVTKVNRDINNEIESVEYTIDNIDYKTIFNRGVTDVPNLNRNSTIKSFVPTTENSVLRLSADLEKFPTTFSYIPVARSDDEFFSFKEEIKLGVVFPPKIEDEIFIERLSISIFEPHARLTEILTLDGLVDYRNGYYNIVNLD